MKKLYDSSRFLDIITTALTAFGTLNWLVGRLLGPDLVRSLFRRSRLIRASVYGLTAFSGLWLTFRLVGLLTHAAVSVAVPRKPEEKTVYPVARTVVGMELPRIRGETLDWKCITLPDDVRGKVVLLAMGYSYNSRWSVEAWARAFRERFGDRDDVSYFEIPMIRGLARLARHYIELGMQHQVPTERWDHLLTVYGSTRSIRESLGATTSSNIWVYLVDKTGVIRFEAAGPYDPVLFEELSAAAEHALTRRPVPRVDMAE